MIWLAAQLWPAALISLVLGFVITWFTVVKPADRVMATRSRNSRSPRSAGHSRFEAADIDDDSDDLFADDGDRRGHDDRGRTVERPAAPVTARADDAVAPSRRRDRADDHHRVARNSADDRRASSTDDVPRAPAPPVSGNDDVTMDHPIPTPAPRTSGVGSAFAPRVDE